MGALFRGKFLAGLTKMHRDGKLACDWSVGPTFDELLAGLYDTSWVVYAKRPFPRSVARPRSSTTSAGTRTASDSRTRAFGR